MEAYVLTEYKVHFASRLSALRCVTLEMKHLARETDYFQTGGQAKQYYFTICALLKHCAAKN